MSALKGRAIITTKPVENRIGADAASLVVSLERMAWSTWRKMKRLAAGVSRNEKRGASARKDKGMKGFSCRL
jgi:hypothetical protein